VAKALKDMSIILRDHRLFALAVYLDQGGRRQAVRAVGISFFVIASFCARCELDSPAAR